MNAFIKEFNLFNPETGEYNNALFLKKATSSKLNKNSRNCITKKRKETKTTNQLKLENVPKRSKTLEKKKWINKDKKNGSQQLLRLNLEPAKKRSRKLKSKRTSVFQESSRPNTPGSSPPKLSRNSVWNSHRTHEAMMRLQDQANEAIRNHNIFTVHGNNNVIRNALVSRGWIEKLDGSHIPPGADPVMKQLLHLPTADLLVGLKNKRFAHVYQQAILSKLVQNENINFYWDLGRDRCNENNEHLKKTKVNMIEKRRFNYCSKKGLCRRVKNVERLNDLGVKNLRVPRTYCISSSDCEIKSFKCDFNTTAAISLLKWIMYTYNIKKTPLISDAGILPIGIFNFAVEECTKFIKKLRGKNVDKKMAKSTNEEWGKFLKAYFLVVDKNEHFERNNVENVGSLVHKTREVLRALKEYYPYINMDGYMNIWILKPSFGSQGSGIQLCRNVKEVLKLQNSDSYVIQKYIERPLLIYNTKFDIRQWFLISSTAPLTIWLYKDCYLRFSSQSYNLLDLHESIHLTNNSVQSKYQHGNHDSRLPNYNMWFLNQFKDYLIRTGHSTVYDEIIYPGIKECIIGALLASQNDLQRSSYGFELHGADFLLTQDFNPWLLEINSRPALYASTPVTSVLCAAVLEDVIKVTVDYSKDPQAPTGNFEMIYQENWTSSIATDSTC